MKTGNEIKTADEATIGTTAGGRAFIRFERRLSYPIEEVWSAVVEPRRMTEWLAHRVEIDPHTGGRLALWLGGQDAPQESLITRFEPPRLLEADSPDWGTMLFSLEPDADGTLFVFVHTLVPGEERRYSIVAGWHLRIEGLESAFAGRPLDWAALDASRDERGIVARIAEIYRHYRHHETHRE
jgi:uncharacterized protein YndB with AHSA1/START domain